ncbi:MAG: DsbC family protein [Comamonadaceae bacterium]|nr:MAG: DsbC family protein [Comamonadaceae bacterium]
MVAGTATAAGAPAHAPAPASATTPSKVGAQADWTLDPIAKQVAQRFASRFDGMDVTAVRMTPYGLYEVQLDTDLVYTNQDVSWVMQGPLIDAQTRENVSAKRLEQLSAIDFADLPKNLAIKQVKGDGSRVIAIFEDPNCGYCEQLRKTLEGVDNLTVYTYLFPILSPDSTEKARNVWCAKDQGKAWDDWMLRGKVPAQMKCDAPIEAVLELGKKLMVRGTPAIFFSDGSRSAGALPLEHLLPRL